MNNSTTILSGAEIIARRLIAEGVDLVFAYIGGAVIPLFDALGHHRDRLRLIRPNHEQGGVHAADGYARVSGKPGVVITTSGPGALNTLTGLGTAFMDSIPLVVITGQVALNKLGSDAFQESDIVGMAASVTKGSWQVRDIKDLDKILKRAFQVAVNGRQGPVLVDVPVSIQTQETRCWDVADSDHPERPENPDLNEELKRLDSWLLEADSPLILCGGGVISGNASEMAADFIQKHRVPMVSTLLGRGVPVKDRRLNLGGIGMHGSVFANRALHHTDLLLVLGSRLSDRILGDVSSFAAKGRVVQVDVDGAEIGKVKGVDLGIVSDLKPFLEAAKQIRIKPSGYEGWMNRIARWRKEAPLVYQPGHETIKPQFLMQSLQTFRHRNGTVVSDVGQHQMWVAQYMNFQRPRSFLTSGGLGTMGYALPAALGAKLWQPQQEVLAICGDGGLAMNMQELETVRRYNLNVKLVVVDNGVLGMVRQWQDLLCDGRHVETVPGARIDYCRLAEAFDLWSRSVVTPDELMCALPDFFAVDSPALLHVRVEPGEQVLPMVPAGGAINRSLTRLVCKG